MQTVDQLIEEVLAERTRDLVDLYELYDHFYEPGPNGFDPSQALLRLAPTDNITWSSQPYIKKVAGRGDVSRSMGPTFNNVSVKLVNVDRAMATFILTHEVEGMRLVIRSVSKYAHPDSTASVVLFTGRLDKPGNINKKECPLSAKQDLATITHQVPWRTYETTCPLEFKGTDCLGNQTLAQKTDIYRNATSCTFSHEDCAAKGNTNFFQGFRFRPISGSYTYQTVESKRFLIFFHKNKTVTQDGQYSSEDLTPYGNAVPFALGRVQAPGEPLQFADAGNTVGIDVGFSEGPVSAITSLKNQSNSLGQPEDIYPYLGYYGGQNGQNPSHHFSTSDPYSRLAHASLICRGGDAQAKDPVPNITGILRGMIVPLPDATGAFTLFGWTDNPAYLTRFVLTDPRLFNISPNLIDDPTCIETANWCDQLLVDDSNAERLFVAQDQAAQIGSGAGQQRRFKSTGVRDSFFYRALLDLVAELPEFGDPDIETFDPASPPVAIEPKRFLRKRYTANTLLSQQQVAVDFLSKVLLPAFRGFITIGANGKLKIRCERPADNAFLREASAAQDQALAVDNVAAWRASLAGEVLIGAGLTSSEVRKVLSVSYSLAGNQITLAANANGTVTATASGSTLAGGTLNAPAQGTITIGGTVQTGAQVAAIIDGVHVSYTLVDGDTPETAAAMLAASINADPTLRRFAHAEWSTGSGATLTIKSSLGWLNLDRPLVHAHAEDIEIVRIAGHFDAASIHDGTFTWPLGSQEATVNQIIVHYREAKDDFAQRQLRINDRPHQNRTGRVDKYEINGTAIDSFHQAQRIGEAEFSKRREGQFLCSWSSGPGALLYEEGDVVAVTDASGGFVNLLVRIESLKISDKRDVSFTARIYSTIMFSDEVGQHTIALPSTLAVQTADQAAPGAVQNAHNISALGTTTLSWERPLTNYQGLDHYTVTVGTGQSGGAITGALPNLNGKIVTGNSLSFALPADQQTYLWSISAHNSYGDGAVVINSFVASSAAYDSIDDGVPVVTDAPTVTKMDGTPLWSIYTPYPTAKGFSVTDCEIEVRDNATDALLQDLTLGNITRHIITQQAVRSKVRYRWRNRFRQFDGTGAVTVDGWSSWSPYTVAYETGGATQNTAETNFHLFKNDPDDIFNPRDRTVL